MPRRRHPRTIEELEHDDAVYGPASPQEEHRLLVELNQRRLRSAARHIQRSQRVLAQVVARFQAIAAGAGAGTASQNRHQGRR